MKKKIRTINLAPTWVEAVNLYFDSILMADGKEQLESRINMVKTEMLRLAKAVDTHQHARD